MILVSGAAGKTGRAVIKALARRGAAVRALVRRPSQVYEAIGLGARDALTGDMADRLSWRKALKGVSALYHICPNMHPGEETIGRAAADAAREAGLPHFVYHSVLHPQTEKMPHHWQKMRVEEILFEAGLPLTVLQPAVYMQNVLGSRDEIIINGLYPVPYPAQTRISLVDLEDVAEAAAVVLTEPGHGGAVYELAGPEAISQEEAVAALGHVLGKTVRAVQISTDEWARRARESGLGPYQVDTLVKMFDYYARFHFVGNANVLRWLLGREPVSFSHFAAREFAFRGPRPGRGDKRTQHR